jgi:hippurate hydrolase
MKSPIPNSVAAMTPLLTAWRRDLHENPELGYQETRTAALVAERLRSFAFDAVITGIGETGVIGVLHGQAGPAPTAAQAIMLRADMDALPMAEQTDLDYKSKTDGVMHACGHDGHTTMLLGAAKHLAATRPFSGTVYFCFQPAEEGGAGAKAMINDGLFERFDCRQVFGMHNWPGIPVGEFIVREGPMLAAADEFRITLEGRGGHAAKPDQARDPIIAAAHLVTLLQTQVSRFTDPLQPAVLSVTKIHGGTAFNVIPSEVEIVGTVRSFDEDTHTTIHAGIARQASAVADAFEMQATTWRSDSGYPPTINDAETTLFAADVLREVAGEESVMTNMPPTMGSEDFSFLAKARPGCFVFCGNGDSASLHHPKYNFDDDALAHGVAYWSKLVERALPAS